MRSEMAEISVLGANQTVPRQRSSMVSAYMNGYALRVQICHVKDISGVVDILFLNVGRSTGVEDCGGTKLHRGSPNY